MFRIGQDRKRYSIPSSRHQSEELLLFTIILKDSHEILYMYHHTPGVGYH